MNKCNILMYKDFRISSAKVSFQCTNFSGQNLVHQCKCTNFFRVSVSFSALKKLVRDSCSGAKSAFIINCFEYLLGLWFLSKVTVDLPDSLSKRWRMGTIERERRFIQFCKVCSMLEIFLFLQLQSSKVVRVAISSKSELYV